MLDLDLVLDLLLFNVEQLRYVVVELEVGLGSIAWSAAGRGGAAPAWRRAVWRA